MTHPDLVVPFRGERYAAAGQLSRLIAPPYDVISTSERARYAAQDAHNIVHLMLPEAEGGERYAHAASLLHAWRQARVLVRDQEPSVYVVAQDFMVPSGRRGTRVGVFVALAAEGYESRRVRPHEHTHAGPKADRLALLRATRTSLESIFVLAPDPDAELARALRGVTGRAPDATAELAQVGIRVWAISGATAAVITGLINRGPVYMADGHHRYETASTYAIENPQVDRLLTFVVSANDEGLAILPTHRIIYGAPVEPSQVAADWQTTFDPAGAVAPWVIVWHGGQRQGLALKPAVAARLSEVETIAMSDYIVRSIVQRAGTAQITYTPHERQAVEAATQGATAAVLLQAPSVATVFRVADAGGIMPPKSTYFFPKVPAGVVLAPWS